MTGSRPVLPPDDDALAPGDDTPAPEPVVVAEPRQRRRIFRGAIAGPLFFLAIFAAELLAGVRLNMMGVHDEEVQRTVFGRFGGLLLRQQLQILAAYLVVGLVLGVASALVLSMWDAVRGRRASGWRRFVSVLAAVALLLGWRLTLTIVRYPQLYVESLYAHGGARRDLQVFLTDHLPAWLLVGVGWAVVLAALLGPAATREGRRRVAFAVGRVADLLARRRRRGVVLAGASLLAAIGVGNRMLHRSMSVASAATTNAPATDKATAASPEDPPSFLLIAVDSLRADRVGPGRAETVAPNLSALAARGVRFEEAHVTIPRTFPSWATILSGRFPAHHGLRHMFPPASMRAAVGPLLPAAMSLHGYRTAVVSDFSGEIFSRLDAGFAERRVPYFDMKVVLAQTGWNLHPTLFPFVASRLGHRLFPALAAAPENADPDRLATDVIDTVERLSKKGPFFVTAFFSTPHFPYAAPDPFYRRFTKPGYEGPFRYDKPVAAFGRTDAGLDEEDVAQIRGLYDGAVSSVDAAVGRILASLAARGLDKRTIVVLLADHGESLFEPGRGMGHGEHLRGDATLHIPLVVLDPVHHFPAHAVPGIVRDVDLAPTLLALANLSPSTLAPPGGLDGVDLGPLLRGERDDLGLPAFAETGLWLTAEGPGFGPDERLPYPALPSLVTIAPDDDIVLAPALQDLVVVAKHRAIRTRRWKLLYVPTREGVRWSLYDLAADPEERVDVASQHPAEAAALKEQLYDWMTLDGSVVEAGFVVPRR